MNGDKGAEVSGRSGRECPGPREAAVVAYGGNLVVAEGTAAVLAPQIGHTAVIFGRQVLQNVCCDYGITLAVLAFLEFLVFGVEGRKKSQSVVAGDGNAGCGISEAVHRAAQRRGARRRRRRREGGRGRKTR